MADSVKPYGVVARSTATKQQEQTEAPLRVSRYGEMVTRIVGKEGKYALADSGEYWSATNPTPGTGIAGIAATGAFADAESLLYIKNGASVGDGTRIYLDFLQLIVTAAGTNGTDHRYVSKIDTGADRYTSGGSSITPVNPNMDSSTTSSATIKFGALVTTAASTSARLVQNGLIRNVITVAGDVYTFDFGGTMTAAPAHAIAGTAIANIVIPHVPVVIGPQQYFVMSLHSSSQTAATSYEFNLGYWER